MLFSEFPNFSEPNPELYGNFGKVCKSLFVFLLRESCVLLLSLSHIYESDLNRENFLVCLKYKNEYKKVVD